MLKDTLPPPDRITKIAMFIAMPTIILTENSPHKSIRVIGTLMTIPLFPLFLIGYAIGTAWEMIMVRRALK